jgi:hypothetical protein
MGATQVPGAPDAEDRRIALLIPRSAGSVEALLGLPLGLDVWERRDDGVVVAASEAQLAELERRRLAWVERLPDIAGREPGTPEHRAGGARGSEDDGPDRQSDVDPTGA